MSGLRRPLASSRKGATSPYPFEVVCTDASCTETGKDQLSPSIRRPTTLVEKHDSYHNCISSRHNFQASYSAHGAHPTYVSHSGRGGGSAPYSVSPTLDQMHESDMNAWKAVAATRGGLVTREQSQNHGVKRFRWDMEGSSSGDVDMCGAEHDQHGSSVAAVVKAMRLNCSFPPFQFLHRRQNDSFSWNRVPTSYVQERSGFMGDESDMEFCMRSQQNSSSLCVAGPGVDRARVAPPTAQERLACFQQLRRAAGYADPEGIRSPSRIYRKHPNPTSDDRIDGELRHSAACGRRQLHHQQQLECGSVGQRAFNRLFRQASEGLRFDSDLCP